MATPACKNVREKGRKRASGALPVKRLAPLAVCSRVGLPFPGSRHGGRSRPQRGRITIRSLLLPHPRLSTHAATRNPCAGPVGYFGPTISSQPSTVTVARRPPLPASRTRTYPFRKPRGARSTEAQLGVSHVSGSSAVLSIASSTVYAAFRTPTCSNRIPRSLGSSYRPSTTVVPPPLTTRTVATSVVVVSFTT